MQIQFRKKIDVKANRTTRIIMKTYIRAIFLVLILGLISQYAEAQYQVKHSVFSNGGKVVQNDNYRINRTVGQPETGSVSNANYQHHAGFWYVATRPVVSVMAAPQVAQAVSVRTELKQNYPNPFNPETWIPYQLENDAKVTIEIYGVSSQLVRHLNLGFQQEGGYTSRDKAAYWDGRNEYWETVASGVYFYRFSAGSYTKIRKMIILK